MDFLQTFFDLQLLCGSGEEIRRRGLEAAFEAGNHWTVDIAKIAFPEQNERGKDANEERIFFWENIDLRAFQIAFDGSCFLRLIRGTRD